MVEANEKHFGRNFQIKKNKIFKTVFSNNYYRYFSMRNLSPRPPSGMAESAAAYI